MIVAAVLPARNEELAIGPVLDGIDSALVRDVVVGDNGSTDRTAEVAANRGARVVRVAERGYGAACAAALAALPPDVEVVVFIDADGSSDPAEIHRLLEPIERNIADLVIGARVVQPGAMTLPQRFGNWLAVRLIRLFYSRRYIDLGPFRAIRKNLLDRIGMRDRRYGWTAEMQIRALQLHARVVEVPVRYLRTVRRSQISGTVAGVVRAGFSILYTIFRLR